MSSTLSVWNLPLPKILTAYNQLNATETALIEQLTQHPGWECLEKLIQLEAVQYAFPVKTTLFTGEDKDAHRIANQQAYAKGLADAVGLAKCATKVLNKKSV